MLWPPIPITDSRGRDSNRQSLKRCRWTGRVFSFLRSPGEILDSRAASSPLFTSQRDCEMSGNICRAEEGREGSVTDQAPGSLLALPTSPCPFLMRSTDNHLFHIFPLAHTHPLDSASLLTHQTSLLWYGSHVHTQAMEGTCGPTPISDHVRKVGPRNLN